MQKTATDEYGIRDQLKVKRHLLFAQLSSDPMDVRVAKEIRLIDDQIAEITERLARRRKAGLD
jgi:hypothetical protein